MKDIIIITVLIRARLSVPPVIRRMPSSWLTADKKQQKLPSLAVPLYIDFSALLSSFKWKE